MRPSLAKLKVAMATKLGLWEVTYVKNVATRYGGRRKTWVMGVAGRHGSVRAITLFFDRQGFSVGMRLYWPRPSRDSSERIAACNTFAEF